MDPAFYGDGLAAAHDAGFGFVAEAAAGDLLGRLAHAGIRSGLVVDLGCGSGILAQRVAAAGFEVFGVDVSPAMLAIARRRVPGARFVQVPALDAEIPACVAVVAVGEVLGYAVDPRAGGESLDPLFARIAAALHPSGVVLCDVAGPGRAGAEPVSRWVEHDGRVVCSLAVEDDGGTALTRSIVLFERAGDTWRRTDEVHRLALIPPGRVLTAMRAAGLSAAEIPGYGDLALSGGWTAFAAHRAS